MHPSKTRLIAEDISGNYYFISSYLNKAIAVPSTLKGDSIKALWDNSNIDVFLLAAKYEIEVFKFFGQTVKGPCIEMLHKHTCTD